MSYHKLHLANPVRPRTHAKSKVWIKNRSYKNDQRWALKILGLEGLFADRKNEQLVSSIQTK